jgi:polyribonucleotide nucleotidyltransferase
MAQLCHCRCCKKPVSDEAEVCPYCGQPSPRPELPVIGKDYTGRVVRIENYGAFVELMPRCPEALLHISRIPGSSHRSQGGSKGKEVADLLKKGQEMKVTVLSISEEGRIEIAMK